MGYEFRESEDFFYIVSNNLFSHFLSTTCLHCNEIGYHCKKIQKKGSEFMKHCICKKCLDLETRKVSFETVMKHNIIQFMTFLSDFEIKNIDKEQKFCIGQQYIKYNLHITIRDKELVENSQALYIYTIHKADSSIHMLSLCLLRLGIYKDLRFSIISKIRKIWWI